jgi:hypothetical protein
VAHREPEQIVSSTVFFELPYDIGADLMHAWTYEHGEPWAGWDAASMAELIGVPEALPPGLRPQYRVAFRRTPTRRADSSASVALAFPEVLSSGQPRLDALCGRIRLRFRALLGVKQNRTVVAVTHWHATSGDAGSRDQIERDVAALNDFLAAYGLVSDDPLLGPLTVVELPSVAPMIGVTGSEVGPVALQGFVSVSPWRQELLELPRDEEDLVRAAIMFNIAVSGDDPTFRVIALLHESLRDMIAGRLVRSVMFAGTAIELLVESTIERAWVPMGLDPNRLAGALSAGFRSQLEHQLAKVLDVEVDLAARGTPAAEWWHTGYALRHNVVHDAQRPTPGQVSDGLRTAFELAAFVGRQLERNDATRDLRGMLPTERVRSRRYGFLRDQA